MLTLAHVELPAVLPYLTDEERRELDALLAPPPERIPIAYRDLHDRQRQFVESPAKRKVIRAGRRGGKTVGVAQLALHAFDEGRRVLYAAPTEDQVKRFWFEVKQGLQARMDAGGLYKNETEHVIEIPKTMNRIRAKTAFNADTLRGDYADLLILDEWQLMAEDAWELVGAPMLLDNDGDAVFIYTPPSIRTSFASKARDKMHAAKMYKRAAADTTGRWAAFHFSSHDNPYLSVTALSEITSDMTAAAYAQEIMAEDREDVPGALWTHEQIEKNRIRLDELPELVRVGVALDPAVSSSESSDEMGIIGGGVSGRGHGYTLRDASMRGTPVACARRAIALYDELGADVMVAEVNNGGEWIGTVVRMVAEEMWRTKERTGRDVNFKMVHASRGKQTRAEPVAALAEHGREHHVGTFPELEAQMCGWVPGIKSPDRIDAHVWLYTELILDGDTPMVAPAGDIQRSYWAGA